VNKEVISMPYQSTLLEALKRIPNDFRQVFTFDMISKGLTALITIVIIRSLTVEVYASYTMFYSIANLFLGILGHGIGLAYVRFSAEKFSLKKTSKDEIIYPGLLIVSLVSLGALFVAPVLRLGIPSSLLSGSIIVGWLLSCQQLVISYFQAREEYKISGIISNLRNILLFVCLVILLMVLGKNEINSIMITYTMSGFLVTCVAFIFIRKKGNIGKPNDTKELKLFVGASFWLMLYNSVNQSFGQIDIQMLRILAGETEIAIYGVAYKYIALMALLLPTLKTVLRVRMSKHEMTSSTERQRQFAIRWMKKSLVVSGVICGSAIIGAQFLFPYINGSQYNTAILPFQVMAISMFFSYVFAPSSGLVMSMGKYKLQFFIACIAVLSKIIGNYFLIPKYGVLGASITYAMSYFILNCSFSIYVLFQPALTTVTQKEQNF
jgi:O-antigen/teichoic acid export membrane protein